MQKLLKISRATIYRMIHDNDLPKPLRLGNRSTRWRKSDIEKFLSIKAAKVLKNTDFIE